MSTCTWLGTVSTLCVYIENVFGSTGVYSPQGPEMVQECSCLMIVSGVTVKCLQVHILLKIAIKSEYLNLNNLLLHLIHRAEHTFIKCGIPKKHRAVGRVTASYSNITRKNYSHLFIVQLTCTHCKSYCLGSKEI